MLKAETGSPREPGPARVSPFVVGGHWERTEPRGLGGASGAQEPPVQPVLPVWGHECRPLLFSPGRPELPTVLLPGLCPRFQAAPPPWVL